MLTRKGLFKDTLRKAAHAWKRIINLPLSEEEANMLRSYVDQSTFTDLHWDQEIAAAKDLDAASFKMLDEFQLCEITELKPADSEMTVKPEETVMGVKKRKEAYP
ncbi:peroxisomal acyl-coenzyme A oxidase 1-like isoform X4 [Hibiscus syriacus]|uniref:peroxisomal acyl-coenzyme A oxidase 1-like isoform X4 n=1 Tax=Hibiscus syriacus TaxID=106335 RepID=UPI001922FEDC|nr:peroxisomal acyl-coenzyme A oxidase 1-like isoform X4 [Hibiscus syriacus]